MLCTTLKTILRRREEERKKRGREEERENRGKRGRREGREGGREEREGGREEGRTEERGVLIAFSSCIYMLCTTLKTILRRKEGGREDRGKGCSHCLLPMYLYAVHHS